MPDQAIVASIRYKVREQVEKAEHLIQLIPAGRLHWNPELAPESNDVGHLLGHLLECLAGFCAVFYAAFPQQLAHILDLRLLPVNHFCKPEEAINRIRLYADKMEEAFQVCCDDDLRRVIPTIFTDGESLATLLLGNLEHLINHKYQLFMYLKILGVPLTTKDIYCWRGNTGVASS